MIEIHGYTFSDFKNYSKEHTMNSGRCVYVVMKGSEIIYIGSTKDLFVRSRSHELILLVDYSGYEFLFFDSTYYESYSIEAELIHILKPKLNKLDIIAVKKNAALNVPMSFRVKAETAKKMSDLSELIDVPKSWMFEMILKDFDFDIWAKKEIKKREVDEAKLKGKKS